MTEPQAVNIEDAMVFKVNAETASRSAQAQYYAAQAQGQLIDNETARILATSAGIALSRETLKEVWEGASNGRNRSYHFTDAVTADSVEQAVDVLNRWQRIDGADDRAWRFVICSNGGSVIHGMKLYSTLKSIARYRDIVTVATGMCASMGTVIHQAGTTRLIEPGCSYMIHDVSADVAGNISAMQDQMDWLNKLNSQLHVALAEKSNLSVEEIAAVAKRRDSWFMPAEVVEMGLADAIGFATE